MVAFLDTNVLIYYLAGEDERTAKRCLALLQRAERREVELATSELVLAEVVWVLQSKSKLSRDEIKGRLLPIVELAGLRIPNKQLWRSVFDLYCERRIDFIDAYNAIWMARSGIHQVYSYDKDFDKLQDIERLTP